MILDQHLILIIEGTTGAGGRVGMFEQVLEDRPAGTTSDRCSMDLGFALSRYVLVIIAITLNPTPSTLYPVPVSGLFGAQFCTLLGCTEDFLWSLV